MDEINLRLLYANTCLGTTSSLWKVVPRQVFITISCILISIVLVIISLVSSVQQTMIVLRRALIELHDYKAIYLTKQKLYKRKRRATASKNQQSAYSKKGADQLRSNCRADQCLCFHFIDSIMLKLEC